jgi:hypothetical protein
MSSHGAEVAVGAFLPERDGELRCLPRLGERRPLTVDAEIVQRVADVLEDERDAPGFAIDFAESRKKNSPPLTWIVVAVAAVCRSLRAEPSWASASAASATAASAKVERIVSCLIGKPPRGSAVSYESE